MTAIRQFYAIALRICQHRAIKSFAPIKIATELFIEFSLGRKFVRGCRLGANVIAVGDYTWATLSSGTETAITNIRIIILFQCI